MAAPVTRRISQFTSQNLIITDQSLREPYRQRTDENKTSIHWGQRKLHLSEVEFFTIYWNAQLIPNPLCVYAGAAPGTHIVLLSQMFPSFTFHLYDPADFDIQESDKIRLFKEYFTDEVASRYSGRNDVFFVSDIRTADYKSLQNEALATRGVTEFNNDGTPKAPHSIIKDAWKEAEIKNEDQIWGDMNMQQNWVLVMNPEHALLKFRLPYVLDGNDRIVQYLKGIVYWQVWAPQTSTETRLKPVRNASGVYELADWNILEYEQWCFYQNTVNREKTFYTNPFTGTNDPIDFPELLNDFDSTAEAVILRLYLEKIGAKGDIYTQVKRLSRLITLAINHYRVDDKGAKTLAHKRESPVKSSSKSALDAFRNKKTGRPVKHTAFKHTNIAINPTWRNPASSPTTTQTRTPVTPITITPTTAPPKSPTVIPPLVVNLPPARSPTVVPTVIAPVIKPTIAPVIKPTIIPVAITPPTLKPIITPPALKPTITPVAITPPTLKPTITPVAITPPALKPIITPVPITPPTLKPTITPVAVTPPTLKPVTIPVPITQSARSPGVPSVPKPVITMPNVPRF